MAKSDVPVLIDPLNYDPVRHGPPYIPVMEDIRPMKTASARLKVAVKAMVDREAVTVGQEIEQLFQHFVTDYGQAGAAELAVLLAALRAEAQIHQAHHWAVKGPTYYGDHLLFDRVYSEVFGMVDGLAERAVGSGQQVLVQPLLQVHHMSGFTQSFYRDAPIVPTPEEMAMLSLRAVLRFLVLLNMAYAAMEAKGALSHGTDNLLQDIADNHEKLVYLLKQRASADQVKTASTRDTAMPSPTRVLSRYLSAMEHDTLDALKQYLRDHPGANPRNHKVKEKKSPEKKEPEKKGPETAGPEKGKGKSSSPATGASLNEGNEKKRDALKKHLSGGKDITIVDNKWGNARSDKILANPKALFDDYKKTIESVKNDALGAIEKAGLSPKDKDTAKKFAESYYAPDKHVAKLQNSINIRDDEDENQSIRGVPDGQPVYSVNAAKSFLERATEPYGALSGRDFAHALNTHMGKDIIKMK